MNGSSKTTKCFVGLVNNNVCELRTSCLVCLLCLCLWLDYTMQPFNNSHPNAMIILVKLIIIYRHTQPTTSNISWKVCTVFISSSFQCSWHNITPQNNVCTHLKRLFMPQLFLLSFSLPCLATYSETINKIIMENAFSFVLLYFLTLHCSLYLYHTYLF